MSTPRRQITSDRKALYYVGTGVAVLGVLMFLSTFVTFALHFGDFTDFDANARSDMLRAVGGIVLIIAGSAMMNVGARGWAGSGVMLDPQRAREDVEPWSRMAGGVVNDALSEIDALKPGDAPAPAVKVRCPKCQALNDETSKFCNQCGAPL
jgi:hypothetical protein